MPATDKDNIKITHGFDKQKLSAWVKAEAKIALRERKTLLPFGPLRVDIEHARFDAATRLEIDADGRQTKVVKGRLEGDLYITVAGVTFVIYRKMVVRFENGQLQFDLDPRNLESPGLLKLLTDASKMLSSENDGFKVGVLTERNLPVGVRADLDIGPFDVGGGVSSITGLLIGGFLELRALTPALKFDFMIGTGFNLARKESPFNLTIFILGGGGYFDLAFRYQPSQRALAMDVELSVHVSASLIISLGWIKGGIGIYLGLIATYHARPRLPSTYSIGIFLLISGHVDILGLISIYLKMLLEAKYESLGNGGYRFSGSGMISITIKIVFVKIRVRKSFTKVIAEKPGQAERLDMASSSRLDPRVNRGQWSELQYVNMLV